jgi:polysaccharide lyase-like protein
MLGAAPIGRRGVLLFAVALAALAAMPATSEAEIASPEPLVDVWALEVTPQFAGSVRARLIAHAKGSGINTLALNPHLTGEQKQRVRSLARRFHLRVFPLHHRACTSEVNLCAVVARRPAAVARLARRPYVDLVVLRLRGPKPVPRLTRNHELASAAGTTAPLMLLPQLRVDSGFPRRSWRRAISAVASAQTVNLGVSPSGRLSRRAFRVFLGLLTRTVPGEVLFVGDFETGDHSQWTWGAQCANTSSAAMLFTRGTITVQSEVVGEGSHAARIDLPAANERTACETLSPRPIGVGSDDYYALMVRFSTGWREPSPAGWGLVIAQLNYEKIWGAPVSLIAHADTVALVVQSGLCRSVETSTPGCAYSSGLGGNLPRTYAVPTPLALGAWHELVVHVRWTTDSSGMVEAWHRLKGSSTWNKTVSLTGYPTLQWTTDMGPSEIARIGTTDKIGAYRGQADFPLTVWHDGFVRTTSFASAASKLP